MKHQSSTRRDFLRGMGVSIALPALLSLQPRVLFGGQAGKAAGMATTSTGAPLRMAFMSIPNGAPVAVVAMPAASLAGAPNNDRGCSEIRAGNATETPMPRRKVRRVED